MPFDTRTNPGPSPAAQHHRHADSWRQRGRRCPFQHPPSPSAAISRSPTSTCWSATRSVTSSSHSPPAPCRRGSAPAMSDRQCRDTDEHDHGGPVTRRARPLTHSEFRTVHDGVQAWAYLLAESVVHRGTEPSLSTACRAAPAGYISNARSLHTGAQLRRCVSPSRARQPQTGARSPPPRAIRGIVALEAPPAASHCGVPHSL